GATELLALLRVLDGEFPCATRQSEHLRADTDAAFIQRLKGYKIAIETLNEGRIGGHLRDLELDTLELADGATELLALLRVLDGEFPCATRQSEHLRADTDAAFIQRLDGDLVALADFAQHVVLGHAAIFHNQLAGAGSPDAEFVFLLADGESGKILLDDESSDAFVSGSLKFPAPAADMFSMF